VVDRSYEGFLRLPVAPILIVLWLVGAALLASCGLIAYELWAYMAADVAR
jgi:hypothetical protein